MSVNFEIETTEIPVGRQGGSLTVRGLNTEDVTHLTINYLDDMKLSVAKYGERGSAIMQDRVADFVMELAKDFPSMVTEIISRCAETESPEDVQKIRRLPFIKQIEALKAIAVLSIDDGAIDLKKFVGIVANLLDAAGLSGGPLTTSLRTIISTSENPSPT